jgi:hypothetical protein
MGIGPRIGESIGTALAAEPVPLRADGCWTEFRKSSGVIGFLVRICLAWAAGIRSKQDGSCVAPHSSDRVLPETVRRIKTIQDKRQEPQRFTAIGQAPGKELSGLTFRICYAQSPKMLLRVICSITWSIQERAQSARRCGFVRRGNAMLAGAARSARPPPRSSTQHNAKCRALVALAECAVQHVVPGQRLVGLSGWL